MTIISLLLHYCGNPVDFFFCISGSLHETAKVVNSLFGSATGIARLRQIQPSRERLPQ
jgi:hypothetical protein